MKSSSQARLAGNIIPADPILEAQKFVLSEKDIEYIDEILQIWRFNARAMTRTQLAAAAEAPSVH